VAIKLRAERVGWKQVVRERDLPALRLDGGLADQSE
jgi:hypothetical protein